MRPMAGVLDQLTVVRRSTLGVKLTRYALGSVVSFGVS